VFATGAAVADGGVIPIRGLKMGWVIAWFCFTGASVVFSVAVLFHYPRFWFRSSALLTTSAALIIEPALEFFDMPIWIFGHQGEGCGPSAMLILLVVFVSPLQLGFLLILIGSVIEERKHDPK
jgi:hypothetical protein